jgi:hypothetical protein
MPDRGPACLLNNRAGRKVIVHDLFADDTKGIRRRSSSSIPVAIASTRWLVWAWASVVAPPQLSGFRFVWVTVPIATVVSRILAISGAFEL